MIASLAELSATTPTVGAAYLTALESGALTKQAFVDTQTQFFFAVAHYWKPMAALAERFEPGSLAHTTLAANVGDERGAGNDEHGHEQTFLELLRRLGRPPTEVLVTPLLPGTETFNLALEGLCRQGDPYLALAALCAIEERFAPISLAIARGISARGWLPLEAMIHYDLHATLDVCHAVALFGVLEADGWGDAKREALVRRGFALGAHLLGRLYEGLS